MLTWLQLLLKKFPEEMNARLEQVFPSVLSTLRDDEPAVVEQAIQVARAQHVHLAHHAHEAHEAAASQP